MARVYFTRHFDYFPLPGVRSFIAYKAGSSYTVKRECADRAIAEGRAIAERPPRRATEKPATRRTRRNALPTAE